MALGVCFVKLNRKSDAEKCFKKAFQVGDQQGNALTLLGKLYEDQNENAKAAKVYETYLKIYTEEMVSVLVKKWFSFRSAIWMRSHRVAVS